ncbi:MAG: insulinase family protein [Bacteroidetes bacterium]|nr:MAG: insulinase family protein [Bacteroidota bacterium]
MTTQNYIQCGRDILRVASICVAFTMFVSDSLVSSAKGIQNQNVETKQIPLDSRVVTGRLENGVTYLVRENREPENRAELRLVVNAGSIQEDDDQLGLAHFVEHMAFNGSDHFEKQELVEYLESIGMKFGADINAYTIFDETVYKLQVPTDSSNYLENGIQVLRDWAHGITFDSVEVDKERGVVIEEWRGRLGASSRIMDEQLPVQLSGSKYVDRLPIGTLESLQTFSHESLLRFYDDWYRPDLISVVAVGDFDSEFVIGLIDSLFSDIPEPVNPRQRELFMIPKNDAPRYTIVSDPEATRAVVSVMHRRKPASPGTVSAYRGGLLRSLYTTMLNQRLSELTQIADPPFIVGIGSDGGLGFVRSETSFDLTALVKDGDYIGALETLLTEAERARTHGFTDSELDRARINLLRGMELAYNERDNHKSNQFASEYIRHLLVDESIPGIEYEYELTKRLAPDISIQDVNRLSDQFMGESDRVVSISGPENNNHPLPSETEVADIFARVRRMELTPYEDDVDDAELLPNVPSPGAIISAIVDDVTGITTWTLSNGVQVVLKPTDFKNDQIVFRGSAAGGTSLAKDEDYISALLAVQVVSSSGIGAFNPIALRKKLTGKAASVSPFIGSLSQGFSGAASPQDIETMFQLLYLYVNEPRTDSDLFDSYMSRMSSFLQTQAASPQRAFSDTLSTILSQGHFRARSMTPEILAETDMNVSLDFYRNRFANFNGYTFFFVGAFDEELIRPYVETYLATLPVESYSDDWSDSGIRTPDGVHERTVFAGLEPKSRVALVFSGEADWSLDSRRKLGLLKDILDARLREILREDLGGTYGVSVSASLIYEPYESYQLSISFGCEPDRVDEMVGHIFDEIQKMKSELVEDKYLDNAREARVRAHETNLRENRYWLSSLVFADKHDFPYADILKSPSSYLDLITTTDIMQMADRTFSMDRFVKVVLRPEDDE